MVNRNLWIGVGLLVFCTACVSTGTPIATKSFVTALPAIQSGTLQVDPRYDYQNNDLILTVRNKATAQDVAIHHFSRHAPIGTLVVSSDESLIAFTEIVGYLVTVWDFRKDTMITLNVAPPDITPTTQEIAFSPDRTLLVANVCNMLASHAGGCDIITLTDIAHGSMQSVSHILINQRFDHFAPDGQSLIINGCTQYTDAVLGTCDSHTMKTVTIDLKTLGQITPKAP